MRSMISASTDAHTRRSSRQTAGPAILSGVGDLSDERGARPFGVVAAFLTGLVVIGNLANIFRTPSITVSTSTVSY